MKKIIKCPVCLSTKTRRDLTASATHGRMKLHTNETFLYDRCSNCQTVFLTKVAINKNFYRRYYTFPKITKKSILKDKLETFLNKRSIKNKIVVIEELFDQYTEKIDLLDVGCGDGTFLASLNNLKFNAVGIELNDQDYKKSKEKKLTVYHEDIMERNFKRKRFHIITLWHVIEHIPEPHRLLKKLKILLKPEGIIILATPNIDSQGFTIARERWFHLDAPRHLILYNKNGMKKLSLQEGFQMKKVFSQIFEFPLDLFWSLKHSKKKYYMYPLYPIIKYFSKETLTYVLTKSNEK